MSWIKKCIFYLIGIFSSVVITLILIEIVLRFLPVSEPFDRPRITKDDPILRLAPNRSVTYSMGKDFYVVNAKRTNNYGYTSDIDYQKNGRPRIALIGDSYVEAMQVPNKDAVGGLLLAEFGNNSVYSIGVSGAALSQYIAFAEFAHDEFMPRSYAFIVIGNDFDESLCSVRQLAGHHCYDDGGDLKFIPFEGFGVVRGIARKSALMRYLVFNVGLNWRNIAAGLHLFTREISDERVFAGNTEARRSDSILEKSRFAVDCFFRDLKAIVKDEDVFFVVDADRAAIYEKPIEEDDTYFEAMRTYFMESATREGFHVLDATEVFDQDFRAANIKFEYPTDGHWNARAHKLIAEALIDVIENNEK